MTYITKKDKNGKDLYYIVIDGKKKKISFAEYEAHQRKEAEIETSSTEAEVTAVEVEIEETSSDTANLTYEQETFETVYTDESVPSIEDTIFNTIKGIVEATGSAYSDKMYVRDTAKCLMINYRRHMICALYHSENNTLSAIGFMGTTAKSRKKLSIHDFSGVRDLSEHKSDIIKQIEYIDALCDEIRNSKVS